MYEFVFFFYLKEFVIKTASRTSNAKFIGLISIDEWMKNAADNPNKMKANLNYFEWIFMLKPFQANAKWSICQFHLHESTQFVFFYCSCVPFLDSQPRTRKFNVAAFSEICYYNNFATQNSFIIKITMASYASKFISFSKEKETFQSLPAACFCPLSNAQLNQLTIIDHSFVVIFSKFAWMIIQVSIMTNKMIVRTQSYIIY